MTLDWNIMITEQPLHPQVGTVLTQGSQRQIGLEGALP